MSRKSRLSHPFDRKGFTLVELLVAMAVVGVVLGAIYGIFISSNRSYHTQDSVAEAQQGVRLGLAFMVRNMRMAGLDPIGPANDSVDGHGAGIKEATSAKIRFTADMDLDGTIEESDSERITYEYDAGNRRLEQCLYEGTGSESTQTVITNVSALAFSYLDKDGNNLTVPVSASDLEDVRAVAISMTCQGVDGHGKNFTRTLNTRVICRNLSL